MGIKIMITGKKINNLAVEMNAGSHTIRSGLLEKLGGKDEGPNPHELLESALAACTILTVQMYADRKGINLLSTEAKVFIVSEGNETLIKREVTFHGDITSEQKLKLEEIASKCPIHKLLESQVKIETVVLN